jgi:hypothetical protein
MSVAAPPPPPQPRKSALETTLLNINSDPKILRNAMKSWF